MATKEAQKLWRQRKKLGILNVCQCGTKLRLESRSICQQCWLQTPEGKAYNTEKTHRCKLKAIDLVAEAKAIAVEFPNELGFVNSATLTESIARNELEVMPGIGFVHFHHRRNGQTTIYSLAVSNLHQKQGWGRLLFYRVLCSLVEYRNQHNPTQNKFTIVAKCPSPLPSNDFYQAMGFKSDGVEPGKKRSRHHLAVLC